MKIIALEIENMKRIKALKIKPDGNLVVIGGLNDAGKSTVLDCIWWALAGATHIQVEPIHRGADKGKIRLDLGEYIVTRTFSQKDGNDFTSAITLTTPKGAKFQAPQTILNGLIGALSFDPLAFSRMSPAEQYDELRQFVPEIDFDAMDDADQQDYDARTDVNRRARQARALEESITLPEGLPDQAIDEAALTAELAAAGRTIAALARKAAQTARKRDALESLRGRLSEMDGHLDERVAEIDKLGADKAGRLASEIETLKTRLAELTAEHGRVGEAVQAEIAKTRSSLDTEKTAASTEIKGIEEELAAEPVAPESPDVSEIEDRINSAREINARIRTRENKQARAKEAADLEAEADAITARMKAREAEKQAAIAAAEMPIPGLSLGNKMVTLGGVPLEQASDAGRLKVSIAIAIAANPELRVVRVRDGSLLDPNGMKLLGEMADKADYQIWVERVGDGDIGGFILEDGHLAESKP